MSFHRRHLPLLMLAASLVPGWGRAQTIGASGVTNTGSSDYVITSNVTLGANQTWTAQNGDIVVSGNINGNGKTLTIAGAHDTSLSGVLSNLTYSNGLTKTGSGTLFLSGNNTFSGTVNIQSGIVQLASNNALGGSAWGNTVQSGGALALANNVSVTQGSFNIGGSGVGGTGSLLNVSGNNTLNASLTLTGDTVFSSQQGTLTLSQSVAQGNYDLTLQGAGNWNVTGALNSNRSGTLYLSGNGTTSVSGAVNVNGGVVIDNSGTTNLSGNLNLGSGSLTIQGDSTANLTGGQVNASGGIAIAGNANANISNTLNLGGADLTLSSAGIIALSGSQINVGDITLSGSGSTTFATQINADSFTQTGTGTTTFDGTGNNYFGSVSLEGGTVVSNQNGVAFFTNNLSLDNVVLDFGADTQIPEWASVTLGDNVSLLLNGTTQMWDNLVITGNSVIDFGNGNANLAIGSLTINPGAALTILNWSSENLDVFNAHVDPAAAKPNIIFSGGGGATWDPVTGNITPIGVVPEPDTYGAVFMTATLLGWLGCSRRRPGTVRPSA